MDNQDKSPVLSPTKDMSKNAKLVVTFVTLAWILDAIDATIYSFTLPMIMEEFGITATEAGIVASLFFFGTVAGGLIVPMLAEKKGRKIGAITCIGLFSAFTALIGFAQSIMQVAILRFFTGSGTGPLWAIGSGYITEVVPGDKKARSIGIMSVGYPIGWFLTSLLFLAVISLGGGWRHVYLVLLIPAILLIPLWAKLKESPVWIANRDKILQEKMESAKAKTKISYVELFRGGNLRSTIVSTVLHCSIAVYGWGMLVWIPTAFKIDFGMDPAMVSYTTMVFFAFAIVGYAISGILSDKIGFKTVLTVYIALGVLSVATLNYLHRWESVPTLLLFSILGILGWSYGAYVVVITYTNLIFPSHIRTLGVAFGISCGKVLTLITPIVVGMIVDRYHPSLGLLMCALFGLLTIPAILLGPDARKQLA